jgi:molybdopterin-dependent oxidoreductase alpha subunit
MSLEDWIARLKRVVPFGLGQTKPHHYRDMLKVAWKNRDNLRYAWKVLSRGVCDGCALGVAGFHDWTIEGVHLCMTRLNLLRLNTMPALDLQRLEDVSALHGLRNDQLRELGRLAYPMRRLRGERGFKRIQWPEALARIAQHVRASDPHRLAFFLTSRGITNEVYYVAQKVARFLGTNNVDNAARLCHSPSTGAMKRAIGVAASTCSYRDWWGTGLVIFFGANPANDQPVALKYLHEAKKTGTKVVLVNPYCEPGMKRYWVPSTAQSALFGSDIVDCWFSVAQGGDIAFLYGVCKILLANGWYHRAFVENHTTGLEALAAELSHLDWPILEQQSGLPRARMEEFARLLHDAKTGVLVWSMGVTQHACGGDTVSMILNVGLLQGYVGREKCGLMPIRGHSGVQGGAEMGAYSTAFPGGKPINAENAAALSGFYGFPVPDWTGLTAPEMVEAAARGQLDALYCLGGNFLRTLPEPQYVARALANVPLRIHQDIILTDQMLLDPGDEVILLPAKTRYEQDGGGTETTTERRVVFSPEITRQVGEAWTEWKILRELAALIAPERAHLLGCETGQAIREEIAKAVPFYEGIQALRQSGDAFQYGGPTLCAGWKFPTPDGLAHFAAVKLPQKDRSPESFVLSTRRGKQFNTLIYAEVDPLTGAGRDAVFMNPEDAAAFHLTNRDRVALCNDLGRLEGQVFLAPIARGNLQVHWPEGNVLLRRGVLDPIGGVPDYNAQVKLERIAEETGATFVNHDHQRSSAVGMRVAAGPPVGRSHP